MIKEIVQFAPRECVDYHNNSLYGDVPVIGMTFGRMPSSRMLDDVYMFRFKMFDYTSDGVIERWFLSNTPMINNHGRPKVYKDTVFVPLLMRYRDDYTSYNRTALFPTGISLVSSAPPNTVTGLGINFDESVMKKQSVNRPRNVIGNTAATNMALEEVTLGILGMDRSKDLWYVNEEKYLQPVIQTRVGVTSPAATVALSDILATCGDILIDGHTSILLDFIDHTACVLNEKEAIPPHVYHTMRGDILTYISASHNVIPYETLMGFIDKSCFIHKGSYTPPIAATANNINSIVGEQIALSGPDGIIFVNGHNELVGAMLEIPVTFDVTARVSRGNCSELRGYVESHTCRLPLQLFNQHELFVPSAVECGTLSDRLTALCYELHQSLASQETASTIHMSKSEDEQVVITITQQDCKPIILVLDLFHALCTHHAVISICQDRIDMWEYVQKDLSPIV